MIHEEVDEAVLRSEYSKCKKEYAHLADGYRLYKVKTRRLVRQQAKLLDMLQSERKNLDILLGHVTSKENARKDKQRVDHIHHLLEAEKEWQMILKEEEECVKDLDKLIIAAERELNQTRKKYPSAEDIYEDNLRLTRRKAILERRLDQANKKFSEQLLRNKKLREDIQLKMIARKALVAEMDHFRRELEKVKSEIFETINSSMYAYEKWNEARRRTSVIFTKLRKDKASFVGDMRGLKRIIEHDEKIQKFMDIKSNERREHKQQTETEKKRRALAHFEGDRARVRTYKDVFERITASTGESDVEKIVQGFLDTENSNFALFNHVSEIYEEVQRLEKQADAMQNNINKLRRDTSKVSKEKAEIMQELEVKYDDVNKRTTKNQATLSSVTKVLDILRTGVAEMFALLNCDDKPIRALLGGDSPLSDQNVMIYLGIIEQKVKDLLQLRSYKKYELFKHYMAPDVTSKKAPSSRQGRPKRKRADLTVLAPDVPSIEENLPIGAEAGDDVKPIDHEALRSYITNKLKDIDLDHVIEEAKQRRATLAANRFTKSEHTVKKKWNPVKLIL